MDLQIAGKTFLVAGASKGLGFAIAERLVREGANVAISGSDAARIEAAGEKLTAVAQTPEAVYAAVCDVRLAQDVTRWVTTVENRYGVIDGLVVNAGGPLAGRFDDFSDEDWLAAFNLTLMSAIRLIRAALPALRASKGSIVTLTSSSVKEPIDFLLLSNVMRSGVTSLAKSLSKTEAKHGVRFNNLVPGLIATDRMKHLDEVQAQAHGRSIEAQHQATASQIPLGRYGDPAEFADAAAFLLSGCASYITGATLVADGGTMKTLF
ncbi:NADPH-dependent reductase BacG [BD1-7 clade bacterium]|uniref:NADPH-dependent reductase BacG n=1 Tax=BD1-7 clade bacterium TaxID=2029982 RepID=A0A5S9QK51_9GAMM|nr:NADPH-dependent reductase BacG [BD1-7 clade bacterium]CAA0119241.1 NADPH-dependent reductase BacG [BD1-7 clade bacterium]